MSPTRLVADLTCIRVSLLEHRRNEEILEEAKVEAIATVRWNDTVRRDLKAWNIKEEWATDRERSRKVSDSARPATPNRETAAKGEKGNTTQLPVSGQTYPSLGQGLESRVPVRTVTVTDSVYIGECVCVSVCVSFQAYTRRRLWSDRDQIWHTHADSPRKGSRQNKNLPRVMQGEFGGF